MLRVPGGRTVRRIAVLVVAGGLASAAVQVARSQERTDEPAVWGAYTFGKTHALMRGLRKQMEAALSGFLTGDKEAITRNADAIASGMVETAGSIPTQAPDEEEAVWKAARDIVEHARLMQESVRQGAYQGAYRHFADMTNHCIQCHQDRRIYGRFSAGGTEAGGGSGSR